MEKYVSKLQQGTSEVPTIPEETATPSAAMPLSSLSRGWALKQHKKSVRFSVKQREYLQQKFQIGQTTGHKLDPEAVAIDMRYARDEEGLRLFAVGKFLKAQQIQSFFLRLAAKAKRQPLPESDADADPNAAEEEAALDQARQVVGQEIQLQHPIVWDMLNICQLAHSNRLGNVLKSMCEYFDLDTSDVTSKQRKEPYITLLTKLVESCSCTH